MNKKSILLFLISAIAFSAIADSFSLTQKEQQQIFEEAEDWIDDIPLGLQDRLSDAVNHAQHGFFSEIEYFRNLKDTTGLGSYNVLVEEIKGGSDIALNMRLYSSSGERNQNEKLPLLIYFHSGGWSIGSLETADKFCRALASFGNVKVISVEYPLAPEHPYPAAIEQTASATEYIFKNSQQWEASSISLGGDGAGGNIALATFYRLPENINVASLVLFYPLVKAGGELNRDSKSKYGRGYGFDSRLWEAFSQAYKGEDKQIDKTLPPTLLISAGRDIVIDQEKELAGNAQVKYVEFTGAIHGFISDGHQTSAFNKAVELCDLFLTHRQ